MVTDESAIIIWDSTTKTEHFIRGATFKNPTQAKEDDKGLGFIVPTPSMPELKEAGQSAFPILQKALEPRVVKVTRYDYEYSLLLAGFRSQFEGAGMVTTGAPRGGVEILQTASVAGYDATTLKANDPAALNRWLAKNGFIAKPDFADWLKPYVRKGWVVTAFKISKPNGARDAFSSSLVRMSFKTDKPFFPYREPSSQREGGAKSTPRSLRVLFIGDKRMEGVIGESTPQEWPGKANWSDDLLLHLEAAQAKNLSQALGLPQKEWPAAMHLTSFEDYSSPRPGFDDVYFQPSKEQSDILPPPIEESHTQQVLIPLDLFFVLGVIGFFSARGMWRRGRRK